MVLLLTDVFLLLTQILLWIIVGLVIWFFLSKVLSRQFLGLLVLFLFLIVIVLAFVQGGISEPGSVLDVIWRVISFPLTPFGLGLVLLLVLLSGTKVSTLVRRLIYLGLILLVLGSMPIISYLLAQELEMEAIELVAPAPDLTGGGRRVIVLLGRDTTRTQLRPQQGAPPTDVTGVERAISPNQYQVLSQLPIQMTEHADRIVYAAQLYRENGAQAPLIVVSAGRRSDRVQKEGERKEDISEARDIETMLTRTFGIPAGDILLDHDNGNTRNSAENTRRLLQDQQINFGNQIMLVGSALTMNREALTFREVFNDSRIIARPTDFFTLPRRERLGLVAAGRDLVERNVQVTDILPTAEAFYISSQAIQEYLNSFYYFLRGWIRPFQAPNLSRPVTSGQNQRLNTPSNQQLGATADFVPDRAVPSSFSPGSTSNSEPPIAASDQPNPLPTMRPYPNPETPASPRQQ